MGIKVKFSNTFLDDLVQDSNSGIVLEANRTKYVNVSPFQLQNLTRFLKEYLDSLVATYDPELSGIILSHQKIKINPEFNVQGDGTNKLLYIADIYVFRPKIGSILTGVVNQKSKDHVGCLVHRVFNVTIPKPEGDEEAEAVWNRTSLGQDVRFRVVAFDMTLLIPSIVGKILDPSIAEPSNASELDDCLQDNDCENETMKSDRENDDLSDSGGVKTQKPTIVQVNTEQNRLNKSNLIEDNLQNDEVKRRTSLSPRKSVDAPKNKRSSISLSLRKLKDVQSETDSDNFIPPSPVKRLDKSINKEDDFEKNEEETERTEDNFEKSEENKRTLDISTTNITFRKRTNNLWTNDESFGNVSSFLKNLDSPQSCLRRSVSPSSSNNSPANSEKRNRAVRFSTHSSVLTFVSNIESLNEPTLESKSITQEALKSSENESDSSRNLKSGKSIEKSLSETMKSPPRVTSSATILESNEKSFGEISRKISEKGKPPEKQTIVSKSSEKSMKNGDDSESDSNSDDSSEGNSEELQAKSTKSPEKGGESSKNRESLENTRVSSDSDSSIDENLERKDKLNDSRSFGKDENPSKNSENSSENLDDGGKFVTSDNKSPKDIKPPEKDAKTSKKSPTPRRGSVSSVPISQIDDSFDSRRKIFLENSKSPDKRGKVSIDSKTPEKFREKLNFDNNLESRKSVDSLNTSKNDGSAVFYDRGEGSGKFKRKSNEKESGKLVGENEVAQEINPDEIDSINRSRMNKMERNNDTTKSLSTSSSIKNKQFSSVFNLADETPKRTRRNSEKHDNNDEMIRISGIESSRNKDVESGNIVDEKTSLLKSSNKSPVSGNKVHESVEGSRMFEEGKQKECVDKGTDYQRKVSEGFNDNVSRKDDSPEKTIRERTASICEESTVTMLLKDAFSKFWGSKNRKSIETKVDSVDVSTVKDSNKDTDLEKVTKKSDKIKRKSIEIFANSVENEVNSDGGKELNQPKELEKMTKKSGEKYRNSIDRNVNSVGNVGAKDSNQDTDLEQVTKKSCKTKRKSIETFANSVENEVKSDGGKELNQPKELEKMTIKSGEKYRKSIDRNVNSVGNEVKNVGAKDSNQDTNTVEESSRKSLEKKRKSIDSNVNIVEENMVQVDFTFKDTNQDVDVVKLATKAKKKKSKEKQLDKRRSIELCVEKEGEDHEIINKMSTVVDSNQEIEVNKKVKKKKKHKEKELDDRENMTFSLIDSHKDIDVEKLSKKAKKKNNKAKELDGGGLAEAQLEENSNLQDSNQEEKISKKAKKKKNKEKELDDRTEKSCKEKEDGDHEIINKISTVVDSNQEIEVTKKVKKKKKHKEKELDDRELKESNAIENEELDQVMKNEKYSSVIEVGNEGIFEEKLSKKEKKKKKKNKEREVEDGDLEDKKSLFAVDSNQEKMAKKLKNDKNKDKEVENENQGNTDKSSFLHELDVPELSKKNKKKKNKELDNRKSVESYFTEENENQINEKLNKFNREVAQISTLDGYITDYGTSRHKTKKKSNFQKKRDGYSSEIDAENQGRGFFSMGGDGNYSKKKHASNKSFEPLLFENGGDKLTDNKERRSKMCDEKNDNSKQDQQKENKFRKRKSKDNRETIENALVLKNQPEMEGDKQQSIDLEKKGDSFHKKKHRNSSGLEGALSSPKQFSLDGYITDCQYTKLESKKKSSFKKKRDGYASDFEAKQQDSSTKIDEDLKKMRKLKKFSDIDDKNMTGIDGYITDCQYTKLESKKRSSFKKKRDGYASDFEAKQQDSSTKIDEDLKKMRKLKKFSDIDDKNMTGIDGYITDCQYTKLESKKRSSFKKKRDGYASDFEAKQQDSSTKIDEDLKKMRKLKKFSDIDDKNMTGIDGYITDCQSSRHKSKKKSSFKSKRDGYASDFDTSLRTPGREEVVMMNKNKEKTPSEASRVCHHENEVKIIENVSTNQENTSSSHKASRKRKKSDTGEKSEKNDDHCIPNKKIKVMESSSHVSELEAIGNRNNEIAITTEQQQASESFKEGDGSAKKKKRRRRKKSSLDLENMLSKAIENAKLDREELTDKKMNESKNQDIDSLDVSRKRRFSDIVKDVESFLIPTKKSKTMQSADNLEVGINERRKNCDKNEQNMTSNEEKQRMESCEESGKTKSRKSNDSGLEMCKEIVKPSLEEESTKRDKVGRKSSEGITNEEFPNNSWTDVTKCSTEPAKDSKVTDSTSNRLLLTGDKNSKTPKKSAEKTGRTKIPKKSAEKTDRTKTPKKSIEDPKQEKMFKYFSPVKKLQPTQGTSDNTADNLGQYSNTVASSNNSNTSSAEKIDSKVKKVLDFPAETKATENEKKSLEADEKTSKKKKKKRKGDDLLELQQEMINRLLMSKKSS